MATRFKWSDVDTNILTRNFDTLSGRELAKIIGCSATTIRNKAKSLGLVKGGSIGSSGASVDKVIDEAKSLTWEELGEKYLCDARFIEDKYLRYSNDLDIPSDYFEELNFGRFGANTSDSEFLDNYVDLGFSVVESAIYDLRESIAYLKKIVDRGDTGGTLQLAVKRVLFDESAFFTPLYSCITNFDGKTAVQYCWKVAEVNRDEYLKPHLDLVIERG